MEKYKEAEAFVPNKIAIPTTKVWLILGFRMPASNGTPRF